MSKHQINPQGARGIYTGKSALWPAEGAGGPSLSELRHLVHSGLKGLFGGTHL